MADPKGQEPQGHSYNKVCGDEGHGGHEGVHYWTETMFQLPLVISSIKLSY